MIFNLFLVTKQQNGRPSGRGGCLPGQTVPRIQRPVVKNIKVTAKQAWLRDGKTGLTNDMTLKKYQPERADLLINTNSIVDMRWQPIAPMVRRNVFCVNLHTRECWHPRGFRFVQNIVVYGKCCSHGVIIASCGVMSRYHFDVGDDITSHASTPDRT